MVTWNYVRRKIELVFSVLKFSTTVLKRLQLLGFLDERSYLFRFRLDVR